MRFSKMLKLREKVWDVLNTLVTNSKFFERKIPCKSALQSKLFAETAIPRGTPSLLVLGITFALLCCTVYTAQNDREDKRNAGNDKVGNEQHYSSFQAHINK